MSAFLSTHIRAANNTYEKVLMQLLAASHFVAGGKTIKLRNPSGLGDSGVEPAISRVGPYKAAGGETIITFTCHFLVVDDIDSEAYPTPDSGTLEWVTANVGTAFTAL